LNPSRTLTKPYKYPLENEKKKEEEKRGEIHCEKTLV
jgi:hypothetical protein